MAITVDLDRVGAVLGRPVSTIVLMYHRIAAPEHDPFGLSVSPAHFSEQLSVLRRLCDPVRLAQTTEPGATRTRVALTFDDGYVDNLQAAVPALEHHEVPASVFVVSDAVGAREEFWWDQLEQAFRGPWSQPTRRIELTCGERHAAGEVAATPDSLRAVHAFLLGLTPAQIGRLLVALRAQLGVGEPAWRRRTVDATQLRELAASAMIDIGAHTRTHPNLPALTPAMRRAEIVGGVTGLRELLDAPPTTFTFPYGAWDRESLLVCRELGFTHACTTTPGCLAPGQNPLLIPRLTVGDWDGEEFERRLRTWVAA